MNFSKKIHMRTFLLCFVAISTLCLTNSAFAAYKIGDDTSYLKIGGLLQGWATLAEDKAPDGESWENEFYLRRMRLMFYGQINDLVNFFVETDNPNFGKGGDLSMNTFIQDAYLELNLHEAFQMDIGMILLPFSHHGMQGATSLLGLDYHGSLVRYPGGSHKVWRDYGVMFRGMPFGKWLEYRLGIFNGVHGSSSLEEVTDANGNIWQRALDPRNPEDWPRLTARLTFNIFEAEGGAGAGGMFYDGIYLKKTDAGITSPKKILSVGASVDWQKDLNASWEALPPPGQITPETVRGVETSDYVAVAADVFADIPLDWNRLWSVNGQINFYYYNYGDRSDGDTWYDTTGNGSSYTGLGLSGEVGVRYDAFQPLFLLDWFNSTEAAGDAGDYLALYGGFNYWLFGHSTSFKVQFGAAKANGSDFGMAGILQGQLLF